MQKLTLTLIAMLLVTCAMAQKKKINVTQFDGIALGTSADVYITPGNSQSVEIEGDADDIEKLKIEVDGSTLKIKNKDSKWGWNNQGKVTVYITANNLEYISASGSGGIMGKGQFKASGTLKLNVSGSGEIDYNVDADDVRVKISGSGSIELQGSSEDVDVSISGSGRLKAEDMAAERYDISISGSGKCEINVKEEIDASISGSGSVYYKGNPSKVNSHSSGSGKVREI